MPGALRACHTGNAGVLIYMEETDEAVLGVDVFCRDRKGLYMDTPKEERKRLLALIGRRELTTLLFTHEHGDHFCLEDVLEALKENPGLHIISTQAVIRRIREKSGAGILTEIRREETGTVKIGLGSGAREHAAALTLFNAPHMGEQFAEVQNLVCLLEAGGKKILLPGDARPDAELFERTASWSPVIDWLIGPFPLLGLPSSRKKMAAALTVRHALAVHLPRPERDIHGWRASAVKVCERASDGLPVPLFGDAPGVTYRL